MRSPNIVIINASPGKRLLSYGPKCLLQVGNCTIIERQINICRSKWNNCKIVVCCGFQKEKIIKSIGCIKNVNFSFNEDYDVTGDAESIFRSVDTNNNNLILYGDIVFSPEIIQKTPWNETSLVITTPKRGDVGCLHQNGNLLRMGYSYRDKWAQICWINKKDVEKISACHINKKYLFHEVVNKSLNAGVSYKVIKCDGCKVIDVDNFKQLGVANEVFDNF